MFDYMNYLKIFAGKTLADQVDILRSMLLDVGFDESFVEGSGGICATWYYEHERVSDIYAVSQSLQFENFQLLLPKDFSEKNLKTDGEYSELIILKDHGKGRRITPSLSTYKGKRIFPIHRAILLESGYDLTGLQVDHRAHHPGINTRTEIRPCTNRQNSANRKNSNITDAGEFTYDPDHDFRDTFWIYALHNPLGLITWEEMHDLNWMMRDLNKKIA